LLEYFCESKEVFEMNKLVDLDKLLEMIDNVQGEIVIADENIDMV